MNILISGSNRGLGLELVNQYAADGWRVFATCRHPAEATDLRAIAWALEGVPLDILYNNAGIYL